MPDVRVRLLWDRTDLIPAGAGSPPRFPPHPLVGQNPGIPLFFGNEANEWELIAVFRGGSLEEIVSRSRRRTLAVSFGVLLLLGLGVTVIIIGARRAQLLADLQMKFVTGVSHDLRTPLAVICSAADNLAEGVIDDSKHRVKEYGTLIRSEGRKLSSMVEQILQYASLKSGPRKTDLRPVVLRNLVDDVLTDEKRLIDSIGFRVEVDIPEDLPAAWADPGILQQALRNLVCNSLKHGASGCWMRVRAMRVATAGKKEVSVSVEDRGPGIDPEDLPHVFEPFYRGRNASASDIPGSGLGLSVVEQSIIAMGGRVEARSHAGSGSTFTLYLPAAG
jgi:signal transduction histidine kinase